MARSVGQTPVEKKSILVVDAYPMLRHGLVTYLNAQPDLIVCGEADSIPERLDQDRGMQAAPARHWVAAGCRRLRRICQGAQGATSVESSPCAYSKKHSKH